MVGCRAGKTGSRRHCQSFSESVRRSTLATLPTRPGVPLTKLFTKRHISRALRKSLFRQSVCFIDDVNCYLLNLGLILFRFVVAKFLDVCLTGAGEFLLGKESPLRTFIPSLFSLVLKSFLDLLYGKNYFQSNYECF